MSFVTSLKSLDFFCSVDEDGFFPHPVTIMLEIRIEDDLDDTARDTLRFFSDQVPYALEQTVNSVALDVQRRLRDSTIPNAWTNRNRQLPKALTTIIPDDQGRPGFARYKRGKLEVHIGPAMSRGYLAGEGFTERQITGAAKRPKGSAVAVPIIGPGLRRGASGSIPSRLKPKNLRGNKKFFKRDDVLFERQTKGGNRTIKARYLLKPQTRGTAELNRFFPDALGTIERVTFGHWSRAFDHAVRTSRFFPR